MNKPSVGATNGKTPVVLRITLAVICLVPTVIGLVVIATIFRNFASEAFDFSASDEVWMQLFLGAAAIVVLVAAIVLGIILRYARWQAAPQASLALAVIVAGAGVLISGMLQTTVMQGDSESYLLLTIFSLAGLAIGAMPPFMHWWNARDACPNRGLKQPFDRR